MKERSQSNDILAANLRLLADEAARHEKKKQAMAAELAFAFADAYASLDAEERLHRIERELSAFFDRYALSPLSGEERVAFTKDLQAALDEKGASLALQDLLPVKEDIPERISYFRTVYTDEAYEGFASSMHEPTVQYADAFPLSCEDVRSGLSGYCILPCENSDGPLPAMTALADRYELFRVALYRVFHADGENATQFGLFAEALPAIPAGTSLVLRFSAVADDVGELALQLSALSHLGVHLLRADVASPIDEGALPFTLLCSVERAALVFVLIYLRIFAKRLALRGLYEEVGI